ncbi:MAG TPA: hypothetical protein VKR58_12125, partial [Aquella sp.]|nr:hypothetical protein [Aquella sp.]
MYSACPRKYGYSILTAPSNKSPDNNKNAIKDLIKQAYANKSQHGYIPQWDTIKTRVNKIAYENIDISNKEAYSLAYKRSLSLLAIMHQW